MDILRVTPKEVRRKQSSGPELLLVCAYDTEERFREMELEGAISWPSLKAKLPSVAKDREVVFYCA